MSKGRNMEDNCITSQELSQRWKMPEATVRHWRWSGRGPDFYKLNGVIKYPLDGVESFEKERLMKSTSQYPTRNK
jgi:hypothetical protein